jgi:hypothetical protein
MCSKANKNIFITYKLCYACKLETLITYSFLELSKFSSLLKDENFLNLQHQLILLFIFLL